MAEANTLFLDAQEFAAHLRTLRQERLKQKLESTPHGRKRQSLTPTQRSVVLAKTAGRCHICGGGIGGEWETDHVLAHAQGGEHTEDNFLPAHAICNRARWFYGTEEFQWILKLGVWLRTQIEEESESLALELAERFIRHEKRRNARRKTKVSGQAEPKLVADSTELKGSGSR